LPVSTADGDWLPLLVLTVAVTLVRQPVGAVLAVVVSVVVAGLARVPIDWLAMRLAAVALVGICFAVPLVLFGRPDEAVVVAFKAVALAVLAGVLVVSAPLERTARAAWHLGVPGVVIQVALLAYRYVFLLGDELERLRVALRVRGFRNRPNRHSYYTVAAATGTLLARGRDRRRIGWPQPCVVGVSTALSAAWTTTGLGGKMVSRW
jgi:cobalt/nickel transport system permease protein